MWFASDRKDTTNEMTKRVGRKKDYEKAPIFRFDNNNKNSRFSFTITDRKYEVKININ